MKAKPDALTCQSFMEHRIIEKLLRESSTFKVRKPQVLSLFYETLHWRAGESFPYFRRRLAEEVPSLHTHPMPIVGSVFGIRGCL